MHPNHYIGHFAWHSVKNTLEKPQRKNDTFESTCVWKILHECIMIRGLSLREGVSIMILKKYIFEGVGIYIDSEKNPFLKGGILEGGYL